MSEECKPLQKIKPSPFVRHAPRNFLLEDEDERILTDGELSQMRANQKLIEMLAEPEIQKLLREVDESGNRLGALRSVLAQDKQGNSQFRKCLDEMLRSLGYMNENGEINI